MFSLAKAAPALFSDGKLYSQIKDPHFYGRKVMHEFVARRGAAGNSSTSANRISAPFA